MSVIPIDLTGAIHDALRESRREPDGLLHASTDLVGSLRHSQLRLAGAPEVERGIAGDIRLETGTLWHNKLAQILEATGVPFMQEIKLDAWMPEGWSGRADFIFWDPKREGWVLVDLKTTKGEAIEWKQRDGASLEHLWQVSSYWWALLEAGFPMLDEFVVYYFPMNDVAGKVIEPYEATCSPIDRDELEAEMAYRWQRGQHYLGSIEAGPHDLLQNPSYYLTDALEPEQGRVQAMYWNKSRQTFEVKLVPHWSAQFCPFPDELCACNTVGVTKLGEWTIDAEGELLWLPSRGQVIEPELAPTTRDFIKKGVSV